MNRPPNVNHPFFAYGIFKPGQLAFFQLKPFVDRMAVAKIRGSLLIRDGMPILETTSRREVRGSLLWFADATAAGEAYDRVSKLEPGNHYRWDESKADGLTVNVLLGRTPKKGSEPLEQEEWNGWEDPLFTSALDVVQETLDAQKTPAPDAKPLFRLQMAYLLLWSSIERYVSLRYHLGNDVMKKINHLADEPAFASGLMKYVTETRQLYRADQPDQRVVLKPECPEKSLLYYYQMRSNITHRGKGFVRDHDKVLNSGNELLTIFREVLRVAESDSSARDQS
jgi:hypothetical protein